MSRGLEHLEQPLRHRDITPARRVAHLVFDGVRQLFDPLTIPILVAERSEALPWDLMLTTHHHRRLLPFPAPPDTVQVINDVLDINSVSCLVKKLVERC